MQANRRKIAGMSSSLARMSALDVNPFSIQQAKSLDRYRIHKIRRLDRKLNIMFEDEGWKIDLSYSFITRREESRSHSFYWTLRSIGEDKG
jgi:hypothetical protein